MRRDDQDDDIGERRVLAAPLRSGDLPHVAVPVGGERQGRNDFRRIGYNGPCPPPGQPHRYFFKIFALQGKLDLKPGASRQEVDQAMRSQILGQAEWMGKYGR